MYSNSKTHRFIALSIAILIFITSIGIAVDVHLCSVSIIGKAKTCHNEMTKQCSSHTKSLESIPKQIDESWACCNNKIVYFKLEQDKYTKTLSTTLIKQVQDFAKSHFPILTFLIPSKQNLFCFPIYKPPSVERLCDDVLARFVSNVM